MTGNLAYLYQLQMETIECYKCHLVFAVTAEHKQRLCTTGEGFYCPAGHGQAYCETEVQKLKKQLEAKERSLKWRDEQIERQNKTIKRKENEVRAQKAAKTKLKKRIGNGVCPCCQRTFENLQRHMQSKHPDFKNGK